MTTTLSALQVAPAAGGTACPFCGQGRVPKVLRVDGETVRDLYDIWLADKNCHRMTEPVRVFVIREDA